MQRGIGRLRAKASAGGGPAPDYAIDAADFDGTNDWMTRGAALTGAADSKRVSFSFWLAKDNVGTIGRIFSSGTAIGNTRFRFDTTAANLIQIVGKNAANTTILDVSSSAHSVASAWIHVLGSFDLADTAKRHLYINDVSELTTVTTYTDDTMDFASPTNASVGAFTTGAGIINGGLAQLAICPGVYIDLSIEANRRKFISAAGKPVDLGSDGSTAFGSAALVLQNLADGGAAADFATNAGTGGNFTITGTLTTYATSPSD